MQQPLFVARLGKTQAACLLEHGTRPRLEEARQTFFERCHVDQAHTVMLVEQGIVSREHGSQILRLLAEIEKLGPDRFPMDPEYGFFLLQVEKYMSERLGEDVAGRMHTGRSHIDYDAAVARLHARGRLLFITEQVLTLQRTILGLAGQHLATVMPGYTHLQHAQPWTFGHYLLRQFSVFERDLQRLEAAFARTNLSSLGAAALAGTSWPLNRERVAELLGHDGVIVNSHDAGEFSSDSPLENVAVLSILANSLGRLAGDLYVWSSWEFGLVELADDYCSTSSIMPQKKNAYALEVIRGIAGQAIGWLPWMQGIFKSATSSDCDYPYMGDIITEAVGSVFRATDLLRGVLETLVVNIAVMRDRAGAFWSTASNLADEIVRRNNLSFRTAHHVVGRLVRLALHEGIRPQEVTTSLVDRAAMGTIGQPLGLSQDAISRALDATQFVMTRATQGSVNPDEGRRMLAHALEQLAGHEAWLVTRKERIAAAKAKLASAVRDYVRTSGA